MLQRAAWTLYLLTGAAVLAASAAAEPSYNLELRELTGENFAARNVYICECTLEQFNAVPLPPFPDSTNTWEKNGGADGGGRLFLPDEGVSTPPTPPEGTPLTLDLIPEIEGPDHRFIARVLDAQLVDLNGDQGPMVLPRVARDTTMTFFAGRVIHTVTSADDDEYILFSYDEASVETWDPWVLDALASLDLPHGWTYASEVLSEDLTVFTPGGIAEVFVQGKVTTYQKMFVVPEPAPGVLGISALLVLMGLAVRRRKN